MAIGSRGWIWRSTGWSITADSDRELMTLLGTLGVYSRGARFAWKGLSSADYELSSTLSRTLPSRSTEEDVRKAERATLLRAREWGLGMEGGRGVSDLQLLADLQHFGISTRLVDFTSNPMTALWFACQTPTRKKGQRKVSHTGVLLALNVSKFHVVETVRNNPGVTFDDLEGDSVSEIVTNGVPAVVRSSIPNPRLKAQEGYFVAGRTPRPGLTRVFWPFQSFEVPRTENKHGLGGGLTLKESLLQARRRAGKPRDIPFVAILVPTRLKSRLLDMLDSTYNRSARVLFPDYDGLNRYGGLLTFDRGTSD